MKHPPRFAIESPPDAGGIARLAATEAHHMRDVMRLKPGDIVSLIDEEGTTYLGAIHGYLRGGAEVQIQKVENALPRPPRIIAPAIVKGPRMDFIVEKAAELGATELWPAVCARTVGRPPGAEKMMRWRRLAIAASKQSLSLPPMHVSDPRPFSTLIQVLPRDTLALICSAGADPMMEVLAKRQFSGILVASGPEGDFEREEMDAAISAGFVPVGLGDNRLRSETAAIAALAIAAQWQAERT